MTTGASEVIHLFLAFIAWLKVCTNLAANVVKGEWYGAVQKYLTQFDFIKLVYSAKVNFEPLSKTSSLGRP